VVFEVEVVEVEKLPLFYLVTPFLHLLQEVFQDHVRLDLSECATAGIGHPPPVATLSIIAGIPEILLLIFQFAADGLLPNSFRHLKKIVAFFINHLLCDEFGKEVIKGLGIVEILIIDQFL
jgi:hypothetical protein